MVMWYIQSNVLVESNDNYRLVSAIWDTGAAMTFISKRLINELKLKPIGLDYVSTAAGIVPMNQYIVDIVLLIMKNTLFES